jgi:hypothetical protein
VTHKRFYWLAVDGENEKVGAEVRAELNGQPIAIDAKDVKQLIVRANDEMLDMDQPVTIRAGEKTLFSGKMERTIGTIAKSLADRGDPLAICVGEVNITIKE